METMPEKLNAYISVGMKDNEVEKKWILVEPDDLNEVLHVERLIECAIKSINDENVRDSFLICIYANHSIITRKYFAWFTEYLDLSRYNTDNVIEVTVYKNIYGKSLETQNMIMLKDDELIKRYNETKLKIFELFNNQNNEIVRNKILEELLEYQDIITMYYPEIRLILENKYRIFEKNEENGLRR